MKKKKIIDFWIDFLDGVKIIREFLVFEVEGLCYLVLFLLDRFWISYGKSVVLIDKNGKKIYNILWLRYIFGVYFVIKDGCFFYLNGSFVMIYIVDLDLWILFIIFEENGWNMWCIYFSYYSGKIIIGINNKDIGLGKFYIYDYDGKL